MNAGPMDAGRGLVLASASPRRAELLSALTESFSVIPANIDEMVPPGLPVMAAVQHLAHAKAGALAASLPDRMILAADTLVVVDGEALGKPSDEQRARSMLQRLRGRSHEVCTGICILAGDRGFLGVAETRVEMRGYSDDEIEETIRSGEPFDKAGAYGIQDLRFAPVRAIDGCYCNVMGLPLWTVWRELRLLGFGAALPQPDVRLTRCALCPLRPSRR